MAPRVPRVGSSGPWEGRGGVQGPAGLTAALTVCLYSLVRLHSEDVVLSREVWDSVMKGCFSLSQRKASEYLNMGRAVPAETLSCSPCCALQCVPVSQWDCVSSAFPGAVCEPLLLAPSFHRECVPWHLSMRGGGMEKWEGRDLTP